MNPGQTTTPEQPTTPTTPDVGDTGLTEAEEEENLQENIDIIENAGGHIDGGGFWVP